MKQAQELLSQNDEHMDFFISDLRLGSDIDGVQAIANLRADLDAKILGVILTGDTSPERLKYIEKAGLTVLHKPVKANSLAAVLNETVSKTH